MISAKYKGCSVIYCRGLTQYDYGQLLQLEGIEIEDHTEIHFTQSGKAITQYIQSNQVQIPDYMLQFQETINAYLYQANRQSGETIKHIVIYIKPRERPGGYVEPDEPAYSRLLPIGGEEGQYLSIQNGEYTWMDLDADFATEAELQNLAQQIPIPLTNMELEEMLN